MSVLITVDTEVYPLCDGWRIDSLRRDMDRDFFGRTSYGDFGLSYQLQILHEFGLKASFFVEGLFASVVGLGPLTALVQEIQCASQEVQLHLHPEWLEWMAKPIIPREARETIRQFTATEQEILLREALGNLRAAGALDVRAFRAGDFAANLDTLRALRTVGINYDTSLNPLYPASLSDVPGRQGMIQPKLLDDVWEFPVAHWRDIIGNSRHAQLCSCSAEELERALMLAWRNGWQYFVIVSHSFELLKKRRARILNPAPDRIVVNRFNRLCEFLRQHSDKFETCGFAEIGRQTFDGPATACLRMPVRSTAWRMVEQAYRRLL